MLSKSRFWFTFLVIILLMVFALPTAALAQSTGPPETGLPFADWQQFLTFGVVPLVIGLVALFKSVFKTAPDEAWPLVALVLGIGFTVLAGYRLNYDPLFAAVLGIALGAAASGFYSWDKTFRQAE